MLPVPKPNSKQIQKQLDDLFAMQGLDGRLCIVVKIGNPANQGKMNNADLNNVANKILDRIVCPKGVNQTARHIFYKGQLEVSLFFETV